MISAAKSQCQNVRTPACSLPSLCALCCAARSLRWPWNLCEISVLSAQALRRPPLVYFLKCSGGAKSRFCVVQLQPLLLVADPYVMFERRRDPNASIVVAVAMPRPTRVSPQQLRQAYTTTRDVAARVLLWKVLESLASSTQHRLAAVRRCRCRHPNSTCKRFARTAAAHSTRQGEKDSQDKRSRTNCLQSTKVQ